MQKFLLIIILLTIPNMAFACKIPESSKIIADVIREADVIFYGKPILIGKRYTKESASKDIAEISKIFFNSSYEVTFEVEKLWKGAKGKNIYLLDDNSSCSSHFPKKLEQKILIFAKFDDDGLKKMKINSTKFSIVDIDKNIEHLGKPIWENK